MICFELRKYFFYLVIPIESCLGTLSSDISIYYDALMSGEHEVNVIVPSCKHPEIIFRHIVLIRIACHIIVLKIIGDIYTFM